MKNNIRIIILTEGGGNKGYGHLVRCLALYQALEVQGAIVTLLVNGDNSILPILKDANSINFNWLKDKSRLFKMLKNYDRVIVDSYLAPRAFYYKLSDAVSGKILMIDDLNRLEYPQGMVLNPSIYGDKLRYPQKSGLIYLLGRDYILLRKAFWARQQMIPRKKVKNVLIAFGGVKNEQFLVSLLSFLSDNFPQYLYHLVATDFRLKNTWHLKLKTYSNLSAAAMSGLMSKCDLCLSAGGQTLYELVRLAVPVIAICFADNQLIGLKYFSRKGAIKDLGWYNNRKIWLRLLQTINMMLKYENRVKMIKRSVPIIDGRGALRVALALSLQR